MRAAGALPGDGGSAQACKIPSQDENESAREETLSQAQAPLYGMGRLWESQIQGQGTPQEPQGEPAAKGQRQRRLCSEDQGHKGFPQTTDRWPGPMLVVPRTQDVEVPRPRPCLWEGQLIPADSELLEGVVDTKYKRPVYGTVADRVCRTHKRPAGFSWVE